MFSVNEVIDIAVRLEKNAERIYRQAQAEIQDAEITSLLDWITREETRHAEWFTQLKTDVESNGKDPFSSEMQNMILNDFVGDQSFSLKDVPFSKITGTDELINIFIEFEKDTILFYEMLIPFIQEPSTREQLENIISEEKAHVAELESLGSVSEA